MKLAVISTSRIVEEFFQHLAEMPGVTVTALCSRPQSREKAESLAKTYQVPQVYTDEAALFAAPAEAYDAVYIGTANHLHYDTAKRALLAGRSVILEKPFTATVDEAEELFGIAQEKGLWLFEAITTPYLPAYAFLQAQLPAIGPVRGAMASFCNRSARYDDYLAGKWNTTFDPACLGGALNDMNIYNLHYLWGLLGKPLFSSYHPTLGPNGIDTAGLAVLQYDGFTAACLSAKDSSGVQGCVLQGPGGDLVVRGGTNALGEVYSVINGVRTDAPRQNHRMTYEFLAFARMMAENDRAGEAAARQRTLEVMEMLEELHENTV
ncbi:MAG: Gfo/Idh/MocA family oxidoreductase [Gemmiger sp.]|nr:Gfo/Idh/MocA family oxidoreductase [Gemmiger sp.]